jgi:hypothetical protein
MSSADPAVPIPVDASLETPEKNKRSPLLSILSILLALVGGFLIGYSFLSGVTAELDPNVAHSSIYIALFFVGLGIVMVGITFALVGIVRRAFRGLSLVALVLSMLPSFVVLVIAALLFL